VKLAGRTALVTGGGGGLGLAIARALLATRSKVIAVGRSAERLAEAKRQNPELRTIVCDVTQDAALDALVATVTRELPGLDLLVNNAAAMEDWSVLDEPWRAALDAEIATNLTAPLKLISRLLPLLRARPTAAIVNVTSALAYAPVAAIPVYCATKAALHSYSKSLRYQLKGTSVRVVELMPSTIATDMSKTRFATKMLSPEAVAEGLMNGLARDRVEIRLGQAVPLYVMTRLAPGLIEPTILATPSRGARPALVAVTG
jgi:uncharacterized oxidoreductase